ncbi:MAG: hypothetical protein GY756_23015 [bacterium]|nr:hypothetical protein [bacterium]
MFKFSIKQTTIILSFFITTNIIALNSSNNINTTDDTSKIKNYTATVVAIQKNKLLAGTDYGYYGTVEHVARLGSLIYPAITDINGNTIKPGTVLIQLRDNYWKDILLSDRSDINAKKADLLTAIEEYKRYKKLSITQSLSIEKFQVKRALYYDAISDLNESESTLLQDMNVVRADTDYPPFEGIVDKVLFSAGMSGNPACIEISQLNPIGIKIIMPREEAESIKINSKIKINIPNTNITQGIYRGNSILCKDGIILRTENKLESFYTQKTYKGKIIPDVINCYPVELFYKQNPDSSILAIPITSLKKDKKGYYVWKALNTKTLQKDKKLNPIFKVKKTYVILDNLKRNMGGFTYCMALKNPGDLQINDLLLSTLPDEPLKDGDYVRFIESRYILMPGDPVQVTVEF